MISLTTLRRWVRREVALGDAVREVEPLLRGGGPIVGFFQGPRAFLVGRWEGTGFRDPEGRDLDLAECYEARVFCGRGELRWWSDPRSGVGRAAFVSEEERGPAWEAVHLADTVRLEPENRYLLWGQADGPSTGGWAALSEARIGTLRVPAEVSRAGARVCLRSVEYARFEGECSARVVEERFLDLREAEPDPVADEGRGGS